jgi:hypothetical protein
MKSSWEKVCEQVTKLREQRARNLCIAGVALALPNLPITHWNRQLL